MGLFFNTREGAGISKDAPQKKGIARFFELLRINLSKIATANFLYVVLSLPVLTIGLGQVGMTYVCRQISRDQHTFVISDFFETIKKNWKQGLAMGIIDLLVYFLLFYDLFWSYTNVKNGMLFKIYFCLAIAMLILYIFSGFYRYFMIITFNMTLPKIIKNSFLFVVLGVWRNLIIALVLLLFGGIIFAIACFSNSVALAVLILMYITFLPAFICYVQQFCIFGPIQKILIDPYYKDHPNDDIEFRKQLGLILEETEEFE